jgi:hypothetical protein
MAPTSIAQTPTTPTPDRPKNKTVRMTGADGSQLKIQLRVSKKSGQITSAVVHSTSKNGSGTRVHATGARATHASMDEAGKAVFALVAAAQKIGWQQAATTVTKADAFDAAHLPVPGKVAPTATTSKK